MRYSLIFGVSCAALFADVTAVGAQSMMGIPSPAVSGSAPAAASVAPDAPAPKSKPKQKGPPGAVTVVNASTKTVTAVVIRAGDQTTTLSKPLAPKSPAEKKSNDSKGLRSSPSAVSMGSKAD